MYTQTHSCIYLENVILQTQHSQPNLGLETKESGPFHLFKISTQHEGAVHISSLGETKPPPPSLLLSTHCNAHTEKGKWFEKSRNFQQDTNGDTVIGPLHDITTLLRSIKLLLAKYIMCKAQSVATLTHYATEMEFQRGRIQHKKSDDFNLEL